MSEPTPACTIDGYVLQLGSWTPEDPYLGRVTVPLPTDERQYVVVRDLGPLHVMNRLAVVRATARHSEAESEAESLRLQAADVGSGHRFYVVDLEDVEEAHRAR